MKNIKTKAHQSGVSIIELMVGMVVGLFIVGGASTMFINSLNSNRHLLIETRVNQDLRAAADVMTRDIRRANYWSNATTGLFGLDANANTSNPHTGASAPLTVATGINQITYSYARDTNNQVDNNEYFGFKLENGTLKIKTDINTWESLTDINSIIITSFNITSANPAINTNLSKYCPCLKTLTCSFDLSTNSWVNPSPWSGPTLTIPLITFSLTGHAASDSTVQRTLSQTIRVRNAELTGSCPS